MTRLDRYKEQLSDLEARRSLLMRNEKLVQAFALGEEIKEVQKSIQIAEEYEELCKPRPIKEVATKKELDEMGIVPLMIECHLIADMLVEASYMIVDACKAHGFTEIKLGNDIEAAIKANEIFASLLTKISPELCDMLVRNETFNASLHKKVPELYRTAS